MIKKGKKFERIIARIHNQLSGNSRVEEDVYITGKNTSRKRQVDVAIWQRIGPYEVLIAIECKDHARKIGIKEIEAFETKLRDIGAHKGVMISRMGFTKPATTFSTRIGIDLLKLIDAKDIKWKDLIKFSILIDLRTLKRKGVKIVLKEQIPRLPDPPEELILYNQKKEPLGKARSLLQKCWEEKKLPDEPGFYENIVFTPPESYIKIDNEFFPIFVFGVAEVEKHLYYKKLGMEQAIGLENQISGKTVFTESTAIVHFQTAFENWLEISSKDDLKDVVRIEIKLLQF